MEKGFLLLNYANEPQALMMSANREEHRTRRAGPALQAAAFPTVDLALSYAPGIPPNLVPRTTPVGARQQAGNVSILLQVLTTWLPQSICGSIVTARLIRALQICNIIRSQSDAIL